MIESTSEKMKTQQKSSGNKSLGLDPQWVKKSSGGAHKRQTEETRGDARRKSKRDRELQNKERKTQVLEQKHKEHCYSLNKAYTRCKN
jgi:hypothetical protein